MKRSEKRGVLLAALIALGGMGAQCDGITDMEFQQSDSNCKAGQAQIQIMDGMSKRLCGCTEADNTLIGASQTLTCTVNAGTTIFVHYSGAALTHQIIPVSGVSFPASPIYNRQDPAPITTHVFTVGTVGTYSYADSYDRAIFGDIVAL